MKNPPVGRPPRKRATSRQVGDVGRILGSRLVWDGAGFSVHPAWLDAWILDCGGAFLGSDGLPGGAVFACSFAPSRRRTGQSKTEMGRERFSVARGDGGVAGRAGLFEREAGLAPAPEPNVSRGIKFWRPNARRKFPPPHAGQRRAANPFAKRRRAPGQSARWSNRVLARWTRRTGRRVARCAWLIGRVGSIQGVHSQLSLIQNKALNTRLGHFFDSRSVMPMTAHATTSSNH
jgi:hypothetical protein